MAIIKHVLTGTDKRSVTKFMSVPVEKKARQSQLLLLLLLLLLIIIIIIYLLYTNIFCMLCHALMLMSDSKVTFFFSGQPPYAVFFIFKTNLV